MNLLKSNITLLLFLIPISLRGQSAEKPSKPDLVDSLLAKLGTEQTIEAVPLSLGSQFEQNPIGIEAALNKKIMQAYRDAFRADSMTKTVAEVMNEKYNPEFAQTSWKWMKRDSTEKIIARNREFNTLQGYRKQIVAKYELEQNPPSEVRMMLVESLRDATSATEARVNSYATIFRAFIVAINNSSMQRNFSDKQIDAFVENYKTQIRSNVDQEVINQYLIMYRGISQSALNNYISFYEREAGKWLNNALDEGIRKAYEKASEKFVSSLANDSQKAVESSESK